MCASRAPSISGAISSSRRRSISSTSPTRTTSRTRPTAACFSTSTARSARGWAIRGSCRWGRGGCSERRVVNVGEDCRRAVEAFTFTALRSAPLSGPFQLTRGRRSAAFEQHDPGKAAELLALLFRVEPGEQAPQPGEPHGSLEAQRLVPGRAKLRLAPTQRLEELRTLRGGELKRWVAAGVREHDPDRFQGGGGLFPREVLLLVGDRVGEVPLAPTEGAGER